MTRPLALNARAAALAAALAVSACASAPKAESEAAHDDTVIAVAPPAVKSPAPVGSPPTIARPAPPAAVDPRANDVDALLAEFERLRRLPASELAREQEASRHAFNQSRSDASRIRFAMAMTVPGSAPGEETRALELLDPIVKNTAAPLHGLAFLLSAYIHEQRRIVAMAQGLQQNVQGLQQSNQTLQQNVHALQQKLDALRTLERSLSERGEPAPRRR
jgi:hypothetical protein